MKSIEPNLLNTSKPPLKIGSSMRKRSNIAANLTTTLSVPTALDMTNGTQMTPATLKALRGSIKKWEKIVDGTGCDLGSHNCPLCKLFLTDDGCEGCPVSEKTGKPDCRGSPYIKWTLIHQGWWPLYADMPKERAAAKAELNFLKSLLPKNSRLTRGKQGGSR